MTFPTIRRLMITAAILGLSVFLLSAAVAHAVQPPPTTHTLTLNGTSYAPSQLSGPVVHYETPPGITPLTAFTERNQWNTTHGATNLPCPAGIHWIDNANLLTISHCLPDPTTTTTTEPPSTTTTSTVPTTTSTVPATTTTTAPATTTSSTTSTSTPATTTSTTSGTTSTSEATSTTSTVPQTTTTTPPELPATGAGETLAVIAALGTLLATLGGAALYGARRI